MENFPDGVEDVAPDLIPILSYDDTVAYEDQVPTDDSGGASLANRIGSTKVYLLSESIARVGKVRWYVWRVRQRNLIWWLAFYTVSVNTMRRMIPPRGKKM